MGCALSSTAPPCLGVRLAAITMGAVVLLCGGCMPPRPHNFNVNEHNFVKVLQRGGTEELVLEILGNPDEEGPGEVVQFTNLSADALNFMISEACEKHPPDYFKKFCGTNNEQIRLLLSGCPQRVVAAEYLVDHVPIYYRGPRTPCRSITFLGKGVVTDHEFLVRKKQLIEFFNNTLANGPVASQPAFQPTLQPAPQPAPQPDFQSAAQPSSQVASLPTSVPVSLPASSPVSAPSEARLSYSIGTVKAKSGTMDVEVVMKNQTADRKLVYVPCQPTLTDDAGNTYAMKEDGSLPQPRKFMASRTVYPGELLAVHYCFERPVVPAKLFTLTFAPPTNVAVSFSWDRVVPTPGPFGAKESKDGTADFPSGKGHRDQSRLRTRDDKQDKTNVASEAQREDRDIQTETRQKSASRKSGCR